MTLLPQQNVLVIYPQQNKIVVVTISFVAATTVGVKNHVRIEIVTTTIHIC